MGLKTHRDPFPQASLLSSLQTGLFLAVLDQQKETLPSSPSQAGLRHPQGRQAPCCCPS